MGGRACHTCLPVVRVSWEVVAEEALEPSILRLLGQDLNSEMKQGDRMEFSGSRII